MWKGCSPVVVWTASFYSFCAFCRTAGHRAGNPPHMPVSLLFSVWYMRSDIVLPWGWYGVDHSSWILLLLQKCLNEQELNSYPKLVTPPLLLLFWNGKELTILMDPRDHSWKINGNPLQNLNVLAIICAEGSACFPALCLKETADAEITLNQRIYCVNDNGWITNIFRFFFYQLCWANTELKIGPLDSLWLCLLKLLSWQEMSK